MTAQGTSRKTVLVLGWWRCCSISWTEEIEECILQGIVHVDYICLRSKAYWAVYVGVAIVAVGGHILCFVCCWILYIGIIMDFG